MADLTFVRDRFAWERIAFPEPDDFLLQQKMLIPYRGGTAPGLAGNGEHFWELHPEINEEAGLSSPYGFITKGEACYEVRAGKLYLQRTATLREAAEQLRSYNDAVPPFLPHYLYRPPEGRLQKILNDPKSVLIVLCGWKTFRRQGEALKELHAEERDQFAGFLSRPYWSLKSHRADQKKRREDAKFPFAEEIIEIRTENFAVNSLHFDSVAHVLAPECAGDPASVEFFKTQMLELGEKYDLDAIFVKEKERVYAYGCRREEFLGEYRGSQVRQLANWRWQEELNGNTPLESLFDYCNKIKNNAWVVMRSEPPLRPTAWLEEGLPRPPFRLGSMMRAMAYYNENSFLYRRQWKRIFMK